MAMVLDAASKLEVTRRCMGEVFEKIEPICKAPNRLATRFYMRSGGKVDRDSSGFPANHDAPSSTDLKAFGIHLLAF